MTFDFNAANVKIIGETSHDKSYSPHAGMELVVIQTEVLLLPAQTKPFR